MSNTEQRGFEKMTCPHCHKPAPTTHWRYNVHTGFTDHVDPDTGQREESDQ